MFEEGRRISRRRRIPGHIAAEKDTGAEGYRERRIRREKAAVRVIKNGFSEHSYVIGPSCLRYGPMMRGGPTSG